MKIPDSFLHLRIGIVKIDRWMLIVFLLALLVGIQACAGHNMSLQEAKQFAVTLEKRTFTPPPRRIDDVLSMLNQPVPVEPDSLSKAKEVADQDCSAQKTDSDSCSCYFKRGVAQYYLGKNTLAQADIRKGLDLFKQGANIDPHEITAAYLLCEAGRIEAENGNFLKGIRFIEQGNNLANSKRISGRIFLAEIYSMMGNYAAAETQLNDAIQHSNRLVDYNIEPELGKMLVVILTAKKLENLGKFAKAEKYRRKAMSTRLRFLKPFSGGQGENFFKVEASPGKVIKIGMDMANNLAKQGKLIEAEQVAWETLKESISFSGRESGFTGKVVGQLAGIKLSQGNVKDAEKLAHALIRLYKRIGIPQNSWLLGEAQSLIGDILVARLEFDKAVDAYAIAEQMLADNSYYQTKVLNRNRNRILALLKTGQIEATSESVSSLYVSEKEFFGENNYLTAEALALKAMLSATQGVDRRVLEDFSMAISVLFHDDFGMGLDYLTKQRRTQLVQVYIELLNALPLDNRDKVWDINVPDVTFQLVQNLGKGTVTGAANAVMARAAAANDPTLLELVRKEQDLDIQLKTTQTALADAIAAQESPNRLQVIESRRVELGTIRQAKAVLLDEITGQFPKYTNFIRPKSVGIKDVQQLLQPEESMLIVFPMANWTYVWAIPHQGEVRFHSLEITQANLEDLVSGLRMALAPQVDTLGDIPPFDVLAAYKLYQEMLAPVADAWTGAKDLIVIASGPLGQLPFSLLPTSAPKTGAETDVLFSNYRKVPWLIRDVSIASMPSVSNFIATRDMQSKKIAVKRFAGFGDPIFNTDQVATAASASETAWLSSRGGGIHLRGVRISSQGDLDNAGISSVDLSSLNRLPDTAAEINAIARSLNADLNSDVFLGKDASEHRVKTMNLADRQIIVFASHGLLPGDLDGLGEPAIALSAPSVTGEKEDGLLSMSEVLKLKLNADWVVLSACNSGAGKGSGTEAVSGLGRAFIYAGSRALLVSMWPVETTSAKQLTTGLFQYQNSHIAMSRARALQHIMLDLMDNQYIKDPSSDKIVSSYAHPLFWAPFIVFGDGGV